MCRYAYKAYKPHFVCFHCRKQFKRPPLKDVLAQRGKLDAFEKLQRVFDRPVLRARLEKSLGTTIDALRSEVRELVSRCPQCGAPMADLGLDFKPPRTAAIKAWARIRSMHRLGHAWHTCGCDGPGFVPIDATGYAEYLAGREKLFSDQLRFVHDDRALDPGTRALEAARLTELITQVRAEQRRHGSYPSMSCDR